jgi:DNA polymerase-4
MSRRMFDLCETLTPTIERRSVDEGYMDLSGCGYGSQAELESNVRNLNSRIAAELGISLSWGLAANKLVSALASKLRKPRGFVVVLPGQEAVFLAPLEIGRLPGIGSKTEPLLVAAGIRTIADLLVAPESLLRRFFGDRHAAVLALARGEDSAPVETQEWEARSYSQQETFATDIDDFAAIEQVAKRMLDELLPKLRADSKAARTLTVRIRYPGMEDASASKSLPNPSDLENDFYPLLAPLLRTAWRLRRPLRLVGVRLSHIDQPEGQLELFGAAEQDRRRRLAATVDALKRAKGVNAVTRGHQLTTPTESQS